MRFLSLSFSAFVSARSVPNLNVTQSRQRSNDDLQKERNPFIMGDMSDASVLTSYKSALPSITDNAKAADSAVERHWSVG